MDKTTNQSMKKVDSRTLAELKLAYTKMKALIVKSKRKIADDEALHEKLGEDIKTSRAAFEALKKDFLALGRTLDGKELDDLS